MSEPNHAPNSKFDLSLFEGDEDEYMIECDENNNDPIEGCNAIKRLLWALKYYSLLDIVKSKENRDIFGAFVGEVYVHSLDDFAHLLKDHNNLQEILYALKEKKLFNECDVTKCSFASRHYSNDKISMDSVLQFYCNTMDSLHFYIMHLFECGLRTEATDEVDDTKEYDYDNKYFDAQFARISRIISERQHLSLAFSRLKSNNKFNISMEKAQETEDSSMTFMEGLFRYLFSNNIKQTVITKCRDFVREYHYDTDALKADFKQDSARNIPRNIGDEPLIAAVDEFIRATER